MDTLTKTDSEHRHFSEEVKASLQGIRIALADLLLSVDADAAEPQEIARRFGLNKNLTWKIARVVRERDVYAVIPHLPGKAGMRILASTLARAGASPQTVEALDRALDAFDRTVEAHAGDRETLEMMLGPLARDGRAAREEAHRKLSFRGNSATWGVQAAVHLAAHFVAPGENENVLDLAIVSGLLGFRRLRQDVPWAVASVRGYSDDGSLRDAVALPIDPSVRIPEPPLMREFCSPSLPPMNVAPAQPGVMRFEIMPGQVGSTGEIDCVTGWMHRGEVSKHRTDDDRFGEHLVNLGTPAELLIFDLFVHRELTFAIPPTLAVYSQLPGGPLYPATGRDRGRLPVSDGLIELGAGPPDVVTIEVPRYRQMLERTCDRLGFALADFHGFRLRLPYPPIPACAVMRYELPEAP